MLPKPGAGRGSQFHIDAPQALFSTVQDACGSCTLQTSTRRCSLLQDLGPLICPPGLSPAEGQTHRVQRVPTDDCVHKNSLLMLNFRAPRVQITAGPGLARDTQV